MLFVNLLYVCFVAVGCNCSTYIINKVPNTYTIDVSLPADKRWEQACSDYGSHSLNVYNYLVSTLPSPIVSQFEDISDYYYNHYINEPYKSEIDYFAQCMNLTSIQMTFVNLIYDFTAFCTSIVAKDNKGRIIHGRNQDFPNIFRNDTIDVIFINSTQLQSFQKKEKEEEGANKNDINSTFLFRGTTFFGYVGIPTGFKPNGFSITIDERNAGGIKYNLDGLKNGYYPSGWLVRDVLMTQNTFDGALSVLENTKIIAPIYYIVGGIDYQTPSQGAVITRNSTHCVDTWMLDDSEYNWYLVETNYDHWNPPPNDDNRRTPAVNAMNSVGQDNINFNSLFDVLSTVPVLNNNTVYTALMSASNESFYNATIRFAKVNSSVAAAISL